MFVQTNKRISNPNLRCHFEGAGVSFLLRQNIRDREISFQKLIQLFWKLLTPFWTNNGATFLNHEVHKVFLHGAHGDTSVLFVVLPLCCFVVHLLLKPYVVEYLT